MTWSKDPRRFATVVLSAALGWAGGCASGQPLPEVTLPTLPDRFSSDLAPDAGPAATSPAATTDVDGVSRLPWRAFFADANVTALIDDALKHNPDRRIALQRIELARTAVHRAHGALLPDLSANVGGGLRRFGLFTMDGAGNATTDIVPGKLVPQDLPDMMVGFQSSWELDVWGKLWSQRQSASAQVLATKEVAQLVTSGLVADVAAGWFNLVAVDRKSAVLATRVQRQREALSMIRAQKDAGRANELAVKQLEAELNETQALHQEADRELRELQNGLNLLAGRLPQPIERGAAEPMVTVAAVVPGVPSSLLRLRPDVRAAELQVQAANFDVKAAQAAFLPTVTLGAGVGLQAFDPAFLVRPESIAYSLLGGLVAPLVNRAAIEADFHGAQQLQVEALYQYQKAILVAFVEAENSLAALKTADALLTLQTEQAQLRAQATTTADALYRAGQASWLEVLVAQQAAWDAELAVVEAWRVRQLALIAVYRALGGGWSTVDDAGPPPPLPETPLDAALQAFDSPAPADEHENSPAAAPSASPSSG
jgi:NodT family efflux transporter outer membrane factor (OMF) lipoprotein